MRIGAARVRDSRLVRTAGIGDEHSDVPVVLPPAELVLVAISNAVRHLLVPTEALQVFTLIDTAEVAPSTSENTRADTPDQGIASI